MVAEVGQRHAVAMTIATPEVADKYPGITFATFGGNPVSMAASLATLEVIEREDLKIMPAWWAVTLRG